MSKKLILIYLLKTSSNSLNFQENTFYKISDITYDSKKKIIDISPIKNHIISIDSYVFKNYSNINNLSIIIGNNGAGKTTLLKNIQSFLDYNDHDLSDEITNTGIFFDVINKDFYYYSTNKNSEIAIKCDKSINKSITRLSESSFKNLVSPYSIAYLTENLSSNDFFHNLSSNVYDGSPGKTLRNLIHNKFTEDDENLILKSSDQEIYISPVARYFYNETLNQLDFISYSESTSKSLPFPLPKEMKISVDSSSVEKEFNASIQYYFEDFTSNTFNLQTEDKEKDLRINFQIDRLIKLFSNKNTSFNERLFFSIKIYAILNCLQEMFYIINNDRQIKDKNNQFELKYKLFDKFYENLEILNNNAFSLEDVINRFISCFKNSSFPYNEIYKIKERYVLNLQKIEHYLSLNISTNSKQIVTDSLLVNDDLKTIFLPAYFMISPESFLNFSWGLSTGENHFLNLGTKLLHIHKEYKKNPNNQNKKAKYLWLLIDEGNSSFHPEWQAKYIKTIMDLSSEILKDYSIQLFITTHSPLVLSDVPHHNVVYINSFDTNNITNLELKENKTFGQNIYSLFSDIFTIDQIYGQLAEEVFSRLNLDIDEIKTNSTNGNDEKLLGISKKDLMKLRELQEVVNIIGEDVIRYSFQDEISKIIEGEQTLRVADTFNTFKSMSNTEKNLFIRKIIDLQQNGDGI